jgi:hypothetical protein
LIAALSLHSAQRLDLIHARSVLPALLLASLESPPWGQQTTAARR